jgi:hypothetical protein
LSLYIHTNSHVHIAFTTPLSHDGSVTWEDSKGIEHRARPVTGKSKLAASHAPNSLRLQPISIITSAGGWKESESPSLPIDGVEEKVRSHDDDVEGDDGDDGDNDDDGNDGNDGPTSRGEKHAGT